MKQNCSECGSPMRLVSYDSDAQCCFWVCDWCNNIERTGVKGHTEEIINQRRKEEYLED